MGEKTAAKALALVVVLLAEIGCGSKQQEDSEESPLSREAAALAAECRSFKVKKCKAAKPFLEEACEQGHGASCSDLGFMTSGGYGGVTADDDKARALYEKACNASHPEGCFQLGQMQNSGFGGEKDEFKARETLTKACHGDHERACLSLGVMCAAGIGGPTDANKARKLQNRAMDLKRLACRKGDDKACSSLERLGERLR